MGGRAGAAASPPPPHPPRLDKRRRPALSRVPPPSAPPGATIHPPGRSDLDLCPREVLGTQGPSIRPHPPPPVTQGSGSVVLRHRVVSRGNHAPGPGHRSTSPLPGAPASLGGGGLRPQGCRSWFQASGLWEDRGGHAGLWPRPMAALPCWARPALPTGPWAHWTDRLTLRLSAPSGSGQGTPAGAAPLPSQAPPLPPVTFLSPGTTGRPLGSPQWGLCNWGLTALVSRGDVVIRRPGR